MNPKEGATVEALARATSALRGRKERGSRPRTGRASGGLTAAASFRQTTKATFNTAAPSEGLYRNPH